MYHNIITMNTGKDISIKYTNKTGRTDFSVIVFTTNLYMTGVKSKSLVAYKVLKAQDTVQFVHPNNSAISASYRWEGQLITAGPIPAKNGNQYEIVKEHPDDTAIIREGI